VKLLARPLPYAIWAGVVVVALAATAGANPYIFGLTCMLAAVASGAVAIVAVAVVILAKAPSGPRAGILGSMLVTGAALMAAFRYLGTFNWA
jgi:hypothetical protein